MGKFGRISFGKSNFFRFRAIARKRGEIVNFSILRRRGARRISGRGWLLHVFHALQLLLAESIGSRIEILLLFGSEIIHVRQRTHLRSVNQIVHAQIAAAATRERTSLIGRRTALQALGIAASLRQGCFRQGDRSHAGGSECSQNKPG